MRNFAILLTVTLLTTFAACGDKKEKQPNEEPEKAIGLNTKVEGDSTLYGLACDGCTDSVLVFLPETGGDPITFDIIEARKKQHVIGRPKVGDWTCVIVNGTNKNVADLVINLDELKGDWVNIETPVLRKTITAESLPELGEERMAEIDSILKADMKPVEIGFSLKRAYVAQAIGQQYGRNQSSDSPIIYPTPKRYTEWHIYNGHLVLTEGGSNIANNNGNNNGNHDNDHDSNHNSSSSSSNNGGSQQTHHRPLHNDTVDILFLMKDTLCIRYSDGTEKGFYRK